MEMETESQGPHGIGASMTVSSPKARPHVCSFCQATFRRDEHLQRHVRCHTGEKKYQCLCGMTFARNDVFVRHMRNCQKGLSDKNRLVTNKFVARTKTKRACDECAKTKSKCDHQSPCDRCRKKSLKCEKTRNGYEDPYGIYCIQKPVSVDSEAGDSTHKDNTDNVSVDYGFGAPHLGSPPMDMDSIVPVSEAIQHKQDQLYSRYQQIQQSNAMDLLHLPSPPSDINSEICFNMPHLFTDDFVFPDGEDGLALEPDPASIYFASVGNLEYLFNPQSQSKLAEGSNLLSLFQPSFTITGDGFSLARLDPLEAKCNEIVELLKQSDPLDSEDITYPYITRHNMVHLCNLYGQYFRHNLPIVHSPTFDMLKAPPILLLAIMLVGACYSKGSIPPSEVTKLAMRLLNAIGTEPHETMMQCPQISTIQAGILVCCILTCSRDMAALNSVRICFARNLSMCERAGLFEPMDSIDYNLLTEETFDWNLWIERESRRRIACEIFCQDMVHCIFLGRTPDLNPSKFQVDLPGYETCWEAETASECLHRLQSLPQQIRVSTAIIMLTSLPNTEAPLFEASGFGMHVLVNGLHYLLHQATQSDIQESAYLTVAPSATKANADIPDSETTTAIKRLQQDLSGPSVAALADRIVKARGTSPILRINGALNSWRTTWDLRNTHDSGREDCTFKGDPLPFWWLAKLYLVLHYNAHIVTPDSEFAMPRAEGLDGTGKTMVQRKIVGWLSSFRGQRCKVDWSAESWLPDLMKPSG